MSGSVSGALQWQVHGGRGGLRVHHDDLLGLAALLEQLAAECLRRVRSLERVACEPSLVASAALSPRSAFDAESALLQAIRLLLRVGLGADLLATRLRLGVEAYRRAEATNLRLVQAAQDTAGRVVGRTLPALVAVGAVGTGALVLAGRDPVETVDGLVTENPDAVGALAGGAAGLLHGLMGVALPGRFSARTGDWAGALAVAGRLLPDGAASVQPLGTTATPAPTTPGDLLRGVGARAVGSPGEIGILRLRGPDGTERFVVELPGTSTWTPRPGTDPRDLATNVHLAAEGSTAYASGVVAAMAAAGVPPGAPVLLVGHSQGGLVAARIAADPLLRSGFLVVAVLTAGSPLGRADEPAGVSVLSLENSADVVPQLEGRANPDRSDTTTAVFHAQHGSVVDNHDVDLYARAADTLPASSPSVAQWLEQARPFLAPGTTASTERWVVRRDAPDGPT